MKRILISFLASAALCITASAQQKGEQSSGLHLCHDTAAPDSEKARSIPVRHWEFDYFNYGVSGGQEAVYLNFSMALRYNFDTPLVDVGGEFSMGATPHFRYDPLEMNKGAIIKRTYLMLSPVAHYNFRRGKNASFFVGMGLGMGLGTRDVFEGCTVDPEGNIFEESYTRKYFVAALTPRAGVELFRHFRIGMQVRIPTDGEVTIGPIISVTFGGGKKD